MLDNYGREIDYIRISVTDRCNLRCVYCMPNGLQNCLKCEEILSYEEIKRVCKACAKIGIKKIKITGGEPLVRLGIDNFITELKQIEGIEQVTITTNGILVEEHLPNLIKAGIDGINVSLDTLKPEMFNKITQCGGFEKVMSSIKSAYNAGIKVKINTVPVEQFNINEITDIAGITKDYDIQVRFIELMPIGYGRKLTPIPNEKIIEILEKKYGKLIPYDKPLGNGPARYYKIDGFKGKIGFISAISHKFCSNCNRIRLTSSGDLKLCLCYDYGVNLKKLIREDKISDEEIMNVIKNEILKKPQQHAFDHMATEKNIENKTMSQIGG